MRYLPFFKYFSGVVLGVGLSLLFGCSSVGSNPSSEATSQPIAQSPGVTETPVEGPIQPSPNADASQTRQEEASQTGQEQVLPISAEANINGQTIQLEVAVTPEQQAKGLMYRPPLPDDRGMLFPFSPPRYTRFWMKNTPSPLDMIFLREGEVQAIVANAPPCESDPCPLYGPDTFTLIDQVIELRSGRAAELGLEVGDRVEIRFFE
jgi:uncharacterized membrane protein (UPF0127 family)